MQIIQYIFRSSINSAMQGSLSPLYSDDPPFPYSPLLITPRIPTCELFEMENIFLNFHAACLIQFVAIANQSSLPGVVSANQLAEYVLGSDSTTGVTAHHFPQLLLLLVLQKGQSALGYFLETPRSKGTQKWN